MTETGELKPFELTIAKQAWNDSHPELCSDNDKALQAAIEAVLQSRCRSTEQSATAGVVVKGLKVGDTVRIRACRNYYGTDTSTFREKPFKIGETFVIGAIKHDGYPCPIVFPVGLDDGEFWRSDDLELVSPVPIVQEGEREGDQIEYRECNEGGGWRRCTAEQAKLLDPDHYEIRTRS